MIANLGYILRITEEANFSVYLFSRGKSDALIMTNNGFWLHFGQFLQTHLVTLVSRKQTFRHLHCLRFFQGGQIIDSFWIITYDHDYSKQTFRRDGVP
jgi:hypothetical protein